MNFNNTTGTWNESNIIYPDSGTKNRFIIAIVFVVGSATVLFNIPSVLIIIVSLLRKQKLKYITILSLSITDGLLGLSWLLISETLNGEKISFTNCFLRSYLFGISFVATNFQLLGICMERVLVICMNIAIVKTRKTLTSICIAIIAWGSSTLLISLETVFHVKSYDDFRECSFDTLFQNNRQKAYGTLGAVLISMQLVIVIQMISLLLFLIRHRAKTINLRALKKMDIRLCAIIGIVAVLFLLVNSPISVTYILEGYADILSSRLTRNISFLFAGLNSAINPFVYLFRSKDVRRKLKESINYICPCKSEMNQS